MQRMTSRCDTLGSTRVRIGGLVAGAALGLLVAFSMLGAFSATPAGAQDADDPGDLGQGMEIFNAGCSSCHQADGSGSAAGRSLIDVALEQPDRAVHIASVTNGRGNMPSYQDRLTVDEIDAAISYVRLTFLSEGDAMDELPNTGLDAWLFVVGLGLIASGGVAVFATEPALRATFVQRSLLRSSSR